MGAFGFLQFCVGEWQYRTDIEEDPYDRTRKIWHCLIDPEGIHHWEIDTIMGPYKTATREIVRDVIAYKKFQL